MDQWANESLGRRVNDSKNNLIEETTNWRIKKYMDNPINSPMKERIAEPMGHSRGQMRCAKTTHFGL